MTHPPVHGVTSPRRRKRGSVLLLVLVIVVIAAAAIISFTERAMTEISSEGYYVQRERLRVDAYSALETTLAVLNDFKTIDGALYSPEQGWSDPLGYAGYQPREGVQVSVDFTDENSRLPLLAGDSAEPWLLVLFTDLGFQSDEIQVLTDTLLDWIDADDNPRLLGAESEEYLRDDIPHTAANRMPTRLEELSGAVGWRSLMFDDAGRPNGRFESFKQLVSVYSPGPINLNTASESVLRATGAFSDPELAALEGAFPERQGKPQQGKGYYTSLTELSDAVGSLPTSMRFGVKVEVLTVVVTVKEGDAEFRLRAVVRVDSSSASRTAARSQSPGTGPGGQPGQPAGNQGTRSSNGTSTATSTTVGSDEYPFTIVELVEDPPASTIAPTSTSQNP